MTRNRIANLIFLGYLVLFLNLGPDLHRAPVFGLHDSHKDTVCSCGSVHEPVKPPSDQNDQAISKQACDCSLCKFFKQCQVDCNCDLPALFKTITGQQVFQTASKPVVLCISQKARGPPTV